MQQGTGMNPLLVKRPLNTNITQEEFLEDLDCLFDNFKDLYGMYYYWGEDRFAKAYDSIKLFVHKADKFDFEKTYHKLMDELNFIKDGHFYIGESIETGVEFDYAIRYTDYKGIPVIDCKKFYHDNEMELKQLQEFAQKGLEYRNSDSLIFDLRGNQGGSTVYIYDFLVGLFGEEIGYPYKMIQRSSKLFLEWLEMLEVSCVFEEECSEDYPEKAKNSKKIFVLIDERTASAAEEAIAYFKNIENVTIVGNHSAGCGSCGNCITFYLLNSHLKVRFGTGLVLYDGNINIDAEGGFKGDISMLQFERSME